MVLVDPDFGLHTNPPLSCRRPTLWTGGPPRLTPSPTGRFARLCRPISKSGSSPVEKPTSATGHKDRPWRPLRRPIHRLTLRPIRRPDPVTDQQRPMGSAASRGRNIGTARRTWSLIEALVEAQSTAGRRLGRWLDQLHGDLPPAQRLRIQGSSFSIMRIWELRQCHRF